MTKIDYKKNYYNTIFYLLTVGLSVAVFTLSPIMVLMLSIEIISLIILSRLQLKIEWKILCTIDYFSLVFICFLALFIIRNSITFFALIPSFFILFDEQIEEDDPKNLKEYFQKNIPILRKRIQLAWQPVKDEVQLWEIKKNFWYIVHIIQNAIWQIKMVIKLTKKNAHTQRCLRKGVADPDEEMDEYIRNLMENQEDKN
jgi:hypothetical protein